MQGWWIWKGSESEKRLDWCGRKKILWRRQYGVICDICCMLKMKKNLHPMEMVESVAAVSWVTAGSEKENCHSLMYKGPGPCSYSLIMCRLYLCKKSETILQNFFHIFESPIVCFPPSRLLFAFLCTFLRSAAIQLFAFLLSTFLQKSFRLPHNTEMALMGFLA